MMLLCLLNVVISVLLADEPTGNLDPANKEKIINLLIDQAAKSDSTLLVVTHDHSLTNRFDRTIDVSDFSHVNSESSVANLGGSS